MQERYLKAIRASQAAARKLVDDLCADMAAPNIRYDGSARSLFPSIMAAKEVNEFGKLITGLASKTYSLGWSLPSMAGSVPWFCFG